MKLSCSILCAAALLQLAPDAIAGYPNHGVDWAAQRQRWAAGDDPARDLQTKIDGAIASRSPQLTVPAGHYFFGNRLGSTWYFTTLKVDAYSRIASPWAPWQVTVNYM